MLCRSRRRTIPPRGFPISRNLVWAEPIAAHLILGSLRGWEKIPLAHKSSPEGQPVRISPPPQRHHYQFLFLLALYVKSTLGAPYITSPAFLFFSLGPLSNEIATRSPRILQRHCMAVTISSQSSPAEAAVDLLSCHASGRLLVSRD